MSCPSECYLGDNLVFSIACHDVDTGELTDASATTYDIYEDENETQVATGTLAKRDSKTGFYTELVDIASATFTHGKTYTIFITATVDGITGGITYAFRAIDKDYALKRDMSDTETEGAAAAARSPLNAFRFLRNRWSISGTSLSVKKEDDSTTAWEATVTGDSNANPVVSSDPAGP